MNRTGAPAGSILGAALMLAASAFTAGAAEATDPIEELVVAGEQPGPGLWQVRHGDNTLWVLGTVTPVPARLAWRSREVEARIAQSQVLIAQVQVHSDVGLFKAVRLLPAALRARKLPRGQTLATVLDAPLYARWSALKSAYLPKDDSVEGLRPLFAAYALYDAALERAGLRNANPAGVLVRDTAKKAKVPRREPSLTVSIDDPRALIREFAESPSSNEFACFDNVLTRVERDLPLLQRRAEAWATGDVAALRRLASEAVEDRCLDFLSTLPRISRQMNDARERASREWLLAAEGALLRNAHSFVVLRMEDLFSDEGRLAALRARGYEILEPKE